jgi:hypothetical protein
MGKRRNAISGQFTARLVEMQESPAFRVLSLSALRALTRIEIELAHHGGCDNGKLPVTFNDFERYGVRRRSLALALDDLEALGFSEITEHGTKTAKADYRRPNKFRLTYRPAEGSPGDGTHEWRRFKTIESAEAALADRRRQRKKAKAGRSINLKTASGETPPIPVAKRHRKGKNIGGETPPLRRGETPPLSISREEGRSRPTDAAAPTLRLAHDADRQSTLHADDGARAPFPNPAKG